MAAIQRIGMRWMTAALLPWAAASSLANAQTRDAAPVRELDDITVLASPYRIDKLALHGRIRYLLRRVDGKALDLPSSAEQRADVRGDALWVEVCASCRTMPLSRDDAPVLDAAAPWLSLREYTVKRLARSRGVSRRDAHRTMQGLTRVVRAHMREAGPNDEFLTAAQAARTQRGDCNEYARLLAAAGRLRGIPTRVAIGVVYRPTHRGHAAVFAAHSWVQAWIDGAWHSYDAALDGFTAGHLLLAVSEGDPEAELGLLQDIGQVRIVAASQVVSAGDATPK